MRNLVVVLTLCFCVKTYTQNYDFGKVSKEELEEEYNPSDSSASATYLFKYRNTHFEYYGEDGFQLITEIHERIKIYNQEGFNHATKMIGLYKSGSDEEEVNNIKAYTYNLIDGKIEDTKLDRKAIFKTESSKYRDEKKFTMPNINEGCVIEYKYRVQSPFYSNVDDFVFQNDIPTKKLIAKFEAPEYFKFKVSMRGSLSITPKKEHRRGSLRIGSSDIDFSTEYHEYNLSDIPALREEPYVNNINNYRSKLSYELSYTQFPQSTIKYYSTTWKDVVDRIYKSSSFGDELKKTSYFQKDISALIGSVTDPAKKVELIFNYVKSQVKWNGYYGFYADDVRKAYKDHVGSSGDINLMLTAMLRYAGLKANPVLVSTRTHGVPLFPTREGYNYVVTWVKLPDDTVALLDATNKYNVPNVLPFRALNWQGRIIAENGGSGLVDLYPKTKSKNSMTIMAKIDEEGSIEGSYRSIKTNHRALSFRNSYNVANKDDYLEKLENRYYGVEISDYEVKNDTDLSKPIQESYKFFKESQVDIIGDKMYFSPLFYLKTSDNPFKLEKREFPVDFGYPSVTSYRVLINIPEGYKVESVPESASIALPDNLGSFKYKVVGKGNAIQLLVSSQINQSIVSPTYYEVLKEYFNTFIQKEAEQIVLTRI
ncbi:DUF3857 domain-containing protein [Algibacter aquimarinus]|uniref:DUF3857 domain-containing protein n=1 Tax=Algibacter aquimarinus TaxID=1136748 RepID=A0ABP9H9G1_9FLAO